MAGVRGDFLVRAGGVMTGQAVDVGLIAGVKVLVCPAIANMAAGAARLVGNWRAAEIIDGVHLAEALAGRRADGVQLPVQAFHDLMRGLIVAAQAGFGDFRPGLERAFEYFKAAVVGGSRKQRRTMEKTHQQAKTKQFCGFFHAFLPLGAPAACSKINIIFF